MQFHPFGPLLILAGIERRIEAGHLIDNALRGAHLRSQVRERQPVAIRTEYAVVPVTLAF